MVSRQQKRTLKEMEKTSTLASVLKVARMAILEDSSTTLSEPEKQAARVVQFPDEVQQSMRNRIKEKEAQLQIILELITELEDRALKTKRNAFCVPFLLRFLGYSQVQLPESNIVFSGETTRTPPSILPFFSSPSSRMIFTSQGLT